MDRESVERLRFDKRLEHRQGWVEDSDKQSYLEALPDVSEKLTRGGEEDEVGADDGGEVAVAASAGTSQAVTDVPAVGGFTPSGTFSGGGTESP